MMAVIFDFYCIFHWGEDMGIKMGRSLAIDLVYFHWRRARVNFRVAIDAYSNIVGVHRYF